MYQVHKNITINNITANIYYNDILITSKEQSVFNPIKVVCKLSSINGLCYAIQYVGMLNINNLILQTPPQTIYSIKYVANYTYNSKTVNTYLSVIQSGIFANLPSANDNNYIYNCSLVSVTPSNFSESSFSQFIVS
jgi:hypothetical protein